jgi:single-stranded-DNA-specific exonuclease
MQNIQEKRWIPKEIPERTHIQEISSALKVNEVLATLIAQRDIHSYEEAKKYFNPDRNSLHDPFLMKDMQKAVERIENAFTNHENIMIYGDYDVDGTTSVALLFRYFRHFSKNLQCYVPNRFSEGYGVSRQGIEQAIKSQVSLIIAIDCGIKDNQEVEFANENGIDFIICDHHTPGEDIPNALAILNPKQLNCNYPYKELSGCGIGFKLIQAYQQHSKSAHDPFELIDLVAVSIASDIVPIVDENRVLAYLGLKKINTKPILPFKMMIGNLDLRKKMTITDLVFIIGPRLNASGRLSHANHTVDLLINDDEEEITSMAAEINEVNQQRKELDKQIVENALSIINQDEGLKQRKTTVLWNADWHKGVIGIVASRLIETYYRPTILMTESDGILVGSARSVIGFDLYSALHECREYMERFGGHQFAAGLTMKKENFEAFSQKFEQVVSDRITEELLIPSIVYDIELPLEFINEKLIHTIERFGPFGPSNMKPRFISKGVLIADPPKKVGSDHLKIIFKTKENLRFDAIAFKQAYHLPKLLHHSEFDICYNLEFNEWNGYKNIQLNIKDLKVSG